VKAQPGSLEAGRTLARALVKQGYYEEGIATYQGLLGDHPNDASIHALLAVAYRHAGQIEEAKYAANKARRLRAGTLSPEQ